MTSTLGALVAAAPGDLVLPVRPRSAPVTVATPLSLVDAHPLGDGRWISVIADADGDRWTVPLMVDDTGVRRAVAGDGVAEALLRSPASLGGAHTFVADVWHTEDVRGERAITVDQTNESIVVGERAVVKWCVRLPRAGVHGTQPAGERLATLMSAGFTGTPRPWGLLHFADHVADSTILLATVADYLPGAVDGWDWAVDDVRSLARGDSDLDAVLAPIAQIGVLTAHLHLAFASTGRGTADEAAAVSWESRARADLAEAVLLVDGDEGARLRDRAARIRAVFGALRGATGSPLIDAHGDFHVGQVLRHGSPPDYAITDFDGNPVIAPEGRSARQPAAVDVAGMLASLDHVGRVVMRRTDGVDTEVVRQWIDAAQTSFLTAYRVTLDQAGSPDLLDERLIAPLRLQQEIREYLYAVAHLPHWRYVPDAALLDLLPDLLPDPLRDEE